MTDDKPVYTSTGMAGYSEKGVPEDWDFGFGSVTGYRWWWWHVPPKFAGYTDTEWVEGRDAFSYLIGAFRGEWEPGRIEATCSATGGFNSFRFENLGNEETEHVPPANKCGCGFWGYFDPNLPMQQILGSFNTTPRVTRDSYLGSIPTVKIPVLGAIEGTGRVVIGEKGFRAQYAKLKAVCLPEEAVATLSHWVAEVQAADTGVYRDPDDYSFGRSSYQAGGTRLAYEVASESEVMTRLSEAEEILQEMYPDAKVCPDKNSMVRQFPKDEYYA
jgi:hypothetical protein